jgi:predicted AlkP superfamily phosphohydrolase/phosphomutase
VVSFYRELDKEVGELIGRFDSSGSVFIISDHGFCTVNQTIDLNVWLLQEGYIQLKNSFFTRLKYFLWKRGLTYEWLFGRLGMAWGKLWARLLGRYWEKLLGAMVKSKFATSPMDFVTDLILNKSTWLLSLKDVDWSKTRAYCKTGQGQIFINLEGRDPQGVVNSGREYEDLQQEIIKKFRHVMSGLTGGKSQAEIYTRQEIYNGDYFNEMPDITVVANKDGYQAGSFVDFGSNRVASDVTLLTGNHDMHGIFLAKGESVKKGASINGANLIDVTPTILHVLGCKVPEDMDGKVLAGIFDAGFMEGHPVAFTQAEVSKKEERGEMSAEDQKQVLERLRSLGYID